MTTSYFLVLSVGANHTDRTHRVSFFDTCCHSPQLLLFVVSVKPTKTFEHTSTQTQAGILTGLTHGHVVEMRGFYRWDQAYCLAMEKMEGGELCEDILRRVFYSEACARRVSQANFFSVLQSSRPRPAAASLTSRFILHCSPNDVAV